MKLDRKIGVRAASVWLPERRQTVQEAIESGELTAARTDGLGVRSLPVAGDESAAQMAVLAGRDALRRGGVDPARLSLIAHASVYHQGHDFWPVSHYIASELGCSSGTFPMGVDQGSNGGAAALRAAVTTLLADPDAEYALATTADRFGAPVWDRWGINPSVAYGDGATAALLHRVDDDADAYLLLALESATAPQYEQMYRGNRPFSPAPMLAGATDFFGKRMEYYSAHGVQAFAEVARAHVRGTLTDALTNAGVAPDDPRIRVVLMPRIGEKSVEIMFGGVVAEVLPKAAVAQLRTDTGHLGAGDLIANLAQADQTCGLTPGDVVVITGGGSGFTWSTAVLEVGGAAAR
jgi:3-oxoacyl-[acyl-carrier-protein] synthase-3